MKKDTLAIIENAGIERAKAESIWVQFEPYLDQANAAAEKVLGLEITDVSQKEEMKLARSTRLELKNIRVAAEKTRKDLKEDIVKEGRFIDGVAKLITNATTPIEADLKEKEEFAERKERERVAALVKSRTDALYAVGYDSRFVSLSQLSEDDFSDLLESATKDYEARLAEERRIEDERVAKEKADAEERARIEAENARLRAEAEEREMERAKERAEAEAKLAAERAKADAERKAREDAERREREAREAAERAERERKEEELRKEREAREAAERELRERQEAEAAKLMAEQEERARLERAGDKEKLSDYVSRLLDVRPPAVNSTHARTILSAVRECIQTAAVKNEAM